MGEAQEKTCPRCAENVKEAALVCRFCGHEFSAGPEPKILDLSHDKIIPTVQQDAAARPPHTTTQPEIFPSNAMGSLAEQLKTIIAFIFGKGSPAQPARENKIRLIFGATIILVIVLGGAFAIFDQIKRNGVVAARAQYQDGLAAYDRGDYATAMRLFRPLATQRDAKAQNALGLMFHDGKGVTQDFAEALKWYREAAERGLSNAQFNLGNMYYYGQGVKQSYVEAAQWFHKAADQGNADAINNIGAMYATGLGVAVSFVNAAKWYRLAAQHGDATAQNNLGHLYEDGQGVPRNLFEAFGWFKKAAQQGLPTAQQAVGAMLANGSGTAKNEKEAVQWFSKAANKGDAEAQYDLGAMYFVGRGVQKNGAKALQWWAEAGAQGNITAANNLYAILGKPNAGAAAQALPENRVPDQSKLCAGTSGDTQEQCVLDLVANKNYAAARKVYGDMASSGEYLAAQSIGETYEKGEGSQVDYVLAYKWYDIAVALGARAIQQLPPLPDPNGPVTDESVKQTLHNMIVPMFQKHGISSRDKMAAHLNAAQLAEAQNLSRQWQAVYLTSPNAQDSNPAPVPPRNSVWSIMGWSLTGDGEARYIDGNNIKKTGSTVTVWFMQDMRSVVGPDGKEILGGAPGKEFKSTKFQTEFDCGADRERSQFFGTYSEHLGNGELVEGGPLKQGDTLYDWQGVPTDLKNDRALACGLVTLPSAQQSATDNGAPTPQAYVSGKSASVPPSQQNPRQGQIQAGTGGNQGDFRP